MEHAIQVELRTDTTHTLTWLDTALKPKSGMVLRCKDDPRPWTVVHAYGITGRLAVFAASIRSACSTQRQNQRCKQYCGRQPKPSFAGLRGWFKGCCQCPASR
jgi:hypothetical protein